MRGKASQEEMQIHGSGILGKTFICRYLLITLLKIVLRLLELIRKGGQLVCNNNNANQYFPSAIKVYTK